MIPQMIPVCWEIMQHDAEVLLMHTHEVCFHGEKRKIRLFFFFKDKCLIWSLDIFVNSFYTRAVKKCLKLAEKLEIRISTVADYKCKNCKYLKYLDTSLYLF